MLYVSFCFVFIACSPVSFKPVASKGGPGDGISYVTYKSNGATRAQEWSVDDGRVSQQNQVEGNSTAIDLWPAPGVHPTYDSLAEITLHRTRWDEPGMERFNISAMATLDGAAYRFGVEASDGGQIRDIVFCFESDGNGGQGICPFRITPHGVYVCEIDNTCKKL